MNNENIDQDQSRTALNVLIFEYLVNNNYPQSANIFKQESEAKDYNPSRQGAVLLTWFNMFNEVCRIRSGNFDKHDTLVRIESIMVKLKHDRSRCNKNPITRHFNAYREREMAQNNIRYGTLPHPTHLVHMNNSYPKDIKDPMRKDHPHMINKPRNGNQLENGSNGTPMAPYRPIPPQNNFERNFYGNQNLPIHPEFPESQQYFEHNMKYPQENKFNYYNIDMIPEQKDDVKFYNNPVKHPHMEDFMDQKKYTIVDMDQVKASSPNQSQKSVEKNRNRDLNRINEHNRINDRPKMADTNKQNDFHGIQDRNKSNDPDNINDLNFFNDLSHLNSLSNFNDPEKKHPEHNMSTISPAHKNKKLNNLKRISLEHAPCSSCIFQDEQLSLLIMAFEDKSLKILDLSNYQTIKSLHTGLSNIKQISIQKIYLSQEIRQLSENINKNMETPFVWIVCFNTKDTVTHYCKYSPVFSFISDQTIVSQSPVVSLISTNNFAFLLTETDLFFFNLQTEIVEKICELAKNDVKDFLYVNQSVFILKTRTKTVTWNVLTNIQKTIVNEPALLMASTTKRPQENFTNGPQFNSPKETVQTYQRPPTQFSHQSHGNSMWYALLYKEFIQVLDHNLNPYSRIPLMHRLSTLSIFDQNNIFTSVHKRIIRYHNSEGHSFDVHISSIKYIFCYKNFNGRIGLISIADNGEALICEL